MQLRSSGQRKRLRTCNLRRVGEAVRLPRSSATPSATHQAGPEDSRDEELEPGLLVRLEGLNAAKALNGCIGRVQRRGQANRWVVRLLDGSAGDEKSYKAENLVALEGATVEDADCKGGVLRAGQVVRICGCTDDAELNGLRGETQAWNAEKDCWAVRLLETDEDKLVLPGHLAAVDGGGLRAGHAALVEGSQAAELNGRTVHLLEWLVADGRWLVQTEGSPADARKLGFKPRRLRAVGPAAAPCSGPSGNREPEEVSSAVGGEQGDGPDVVETLGGSSSDDSVEEEVRGEPAADVLMEGARVVVAGCPGVAEGKGGALVRWEDVGGPFGQWLVRLDEPGAQPREVSVNPIYLSLATGR